MIDLLFITMCSTPNVNPKTTWEIIRHESNFSELAININSRNVSLDSVGPKKPRSREEARLIGQELLGMKVNFDAGLMQINSVNLKAYGLDAESLFDPCQNIRVGTAILKRFYESAEKTLGPGQDALKSALSAYNTGNHVAGFKNGYVSRFYGRRVPIEENPYTAGIIASAGELPRRRKTPYSASIIPPDPKDDEKSHDAGAN